MENRIDGEERVESLVPIAEIPAPEVPAMRLNPPAPLHESLVGARIPTPPVYRQLESGEYIKILDRSVVGQMESETG